MVIQFGCNTLYKYAKRIQIFSTIYKTILKQLLLRNRVTNVNTAGKLILWTTIRVYVFITSDRDKTDYENVYISV